MERAKRPRGTKRPLEKGQDSRLATALLSLWDMAKYQALKVEGRDGHPSSALWLVFFVCIFEIVLIIVNHVLSIKMSQLRLTKRFTM